ncbi:hypothetical protein HN385_05175 [archaeon]|jgi:hypothetical protein|nr:hypothetical protein [archaeon]MBT3451412.1 hypothetical protein [archaeon]MBT6869243.1 hypothetical protein [archaeon]MBT7193641.1 hypothetical protein [archaeon]MBT7380259.1 hypothetical protein [archaeon]
MSNKKDMSLGDLVSSSAKALAFTASLGACTVLYANIQSYFISSSFISSNFSDAHEMIENYDSTNNLFDKVFSYGGYIAAKNCIGE